MKLGRFIGVLGLTVALVGSFFALTPAFVNAATPVCNTDAERAACQAQYNQLQQEIAQYQKIIDDTKKKEASLQGDVTTLNAQIAKAQAEINQRNVIIGQLSTQIAQKAAAVETLQTKLSDSQDSLAKIIREKAQAEDTPLAMLALAGGSLSDFFSVVTDLSALNGALQDHMNELRGIKTETEAEKAALSQKQDAQLNAKHDAVLLQQTVTADKQQKTQELSVTKGQESQYNLVLEQKQAQATAIRNALFRLRDAQGITFSLALQYAQEAQKATGVRAAFILGILRQESNLGSNVGQCLLTNPSTGAGIKKSTGAALAKVMNPTRDVPPYLALLSRLGLDASTQVVSCPQSVGYGGAMGPSQFIASTWKIYESRIEAATGDSVANPWDAKDAVMATALYMKDLGAGAQTYSAERKAAAQYYAGSSWATLGLSYAASVLNYADQYQQNIDFLTQNNL